MWDLRVSEARAEPTGRGEYRVTLGVEAVKVRIDSAGIETEIAMDDPIEIGVFAAAQGGKQLEEPLYLEKLRVRSGEQTITVTVPGQPGHAGVDPYRLIDRRMDDNSVKVEGINADLATRLQGSGIRAPTGG